MAVEVSTPGPTQDVRPVRRALISVFDKAGLEDLVRGLHEAGVALVSTGGSAALIESLGLPVTKVEQLTGFPECLEGRVKTLHPLVHAGILADTRKPDHVAQLGELGVEAFDLVVVNLYPFADTVASGAAADQIVENIDIGGPSMVRAAAKNHPSVAVVTDPSTYGDVLDAVRAGGFTFAQRQRLAAQAFVHTATYDVAVASWMGNAYTDTSDGTGFPAWAGATWDKAAVLRYGENPHQQAALYTNGFQPQPGLAQAIQLHGKEMSYNNYIDADAAVRAAYDHGDQPTVAVIKHGNPCGIAVGTDIAQAHRKAHECDPVSAFGGIIATNRPVTLEMARTVADIFTEVVVAPGSTTMPSRCSRRRRTSASCSARLPAAVAWRRARSAAACSCSSAMVSTPWCAATTTRSPAATTWRTGAWSPATRPTTRPWQTSSSPGGRCAREVQRHPARPRGGIGRHRHGPGQPGRLLPPRRLTRR